MLACRLRISRSYSRLRHAAPSRADNAEARNEGPRLFPRIFLRSFDAGDLTSSTPHLNGLSVAGMAGRRLHDENSMDGGVLSDCGMRDSGGDGAASDSAAGDSAASDSADSDSADTGSAAEQLGGG